MRDDPKLVSHIASVAFMAAALLVGILAVGSAGASSLFGP